MLFVSVAIHLFFIWYFGDVDFEPDSYLHFLYSASAFSRLPESLNFAVGVWPTPLFTLLCGAITWISGVRLLWIIRVFNTLVWAVVEFLTYRVACQLRLPTSIALISVFLTEFSFLSFRLSIGTLTEPLFTLLVMGTIVTLYDKKYTTCCMLASLSVLVRSEGLVLLPVWIAVLWLVHRRRRFMDIVVLAVFPNR